MNHETLAQDDLIQSIIDELRTKCHSVALDLALDIGETIIVRLFGSIEAWRSNTDQDLTLRRLTERPDLPISVASLHRALSVYELWTRLPADEARLWRKQIGFSHVRAVLGLPLSSQRGLLADAYAHQWTAEQVEAESSRLRHIFRGARGRPPLPPAVKAARRLLRIAIAENQSLVGAGIRTDHEREELRATIEVLKQSIHSLQICLEEAT